MKKILVLVLLFSAVVLAAQTPDVVINEFAAKANPEWIELYNTSGSTVDLSGWIIVNTPDDTLFLSGSITAGSYYVNTSITGLNNSGDIICLIDNTGTIIDSVGYGDSGPAPTGIYNNNNPAWSTARITDGLYTGDVARDFNVDGTPTQGTANDAAAAPLNAIIAINEVDPYPPNTGEPDSVELFNASYSPIDITGWFISDGDDFGLIGSHIVPAGGFLVIDEDETGVDFSSADVCYLFMPDTQRVDQMGWEGEYNDSTFQRVPDGSGPHDGYNWVSSGGGTVLFDKAETWGYSNGGSGVMEEPVIVDNHEVSLICSPFNSNGNIMVSFAAQQDVTVKIYSLDGRLVKELFNGDASSGITIYWDGKDHSGYEVSYGSYIVLMQSEDQQISNKVNLFVK